MKNLYDMVVEAVTALNDGFSAHNVTQWVRQMANAAHQNNEELDLPLSDDPAFKWYVSHEEVKQHMEQLYSLHVVDRSFGNGYFVYHVVTTHATSATVTPNVPTTAPSTPVTSDATLLNKLVNYVNNYRSRHGYTPTAKQVQSRLKRDCNMTCHELLYFASKNNIPVITNATPSVSTIG